ncbi:MAG: glycosyltransferase family 9 protein [Lentisphaerota bacterium]
MKQPRILVFRGGAIGDFILTLPALQALRERWPDAYVELIGYPHVAHLALASDVVDHVVSLDRAEMARFFSPEPSFSEKQAEHVASFDLIISYLHDPAGVVKANLELAGARQVIYGSPLVKEGHAGDHLLQPLEALAIYAKGSLPLLNLRPEIREGGKKWLREHGMAEAPVAIHPGSGSPRKNWPLDRFLDITCRLKERGISFFWILGEADQPIREHPALMSGGMTLLENCALVDVAGVLSHCSVYLGNDSGITHLAAALPIQVVALFGPSDASMWSPRGAHVKTLVAGDRDLSSLPVEEVWKSLENRRSESGMDIPVQLGYKRGTEFGAGVIQR